MCYLNVIWLSYDFDSDGAFIDNIHWLRLKLDSGVVGEFWHDLKWLDAPAAPETPVFLKD